MNLNKKDQCRHMVEINQKKPSKFFKWFCGTWIGRLFYGDLAKDLETYEYMDHFMATHPNEKPGPIPEYLLEPIHTNGKTTPTPQTTSAPVVENETPTAKTPKVALMDREQLLKAGASKEAIDALEKQMIMNAQRSGVASIIGQHGVSVDLGALDLNPQDLNIIQNYYAQNQNRFNS